MNSLTTLPLEVPISIDTRTLSSGSVFVALKGHKMDGHRFVSQAFEKGASCAVVDRPIIFNKPHIVVPDTLEALNELARLRRQETRAKIVGITGSVGKTTLKEMLAALCAPFGPVIFSSLSHNNHIGVPLSLTKLMPDSAYGIFEIGTSNPGEIEPLSRLICPHIAVITTVDMAHMANFATFEDLCLEKGSIAHGLDAQGVLIRPQALNIAHSNLVCVEDTIRLVSCQLTATGSRVEASIDDKPFGYTLQAPGKHMVDLSLIALACLKKLGIPLLSPTVQSILATFSPPKGRGCPILLKRDALSFTLIDSSYNANPASMKSAISLLALTSPHRRRVAILGDMLNLGVWQERAHEDLAQVLIDANIDLVIACGPLMRRTFDLLPTPMQGFWTAEQKDIDTHIWEYLKSDDSVLVKGSFDTHLHQLVQRWKAYRP